MDTLGLDLNKFIPHLPSAIERPQLVAKLNNALKYKLILISAPPGYGKTTIASQFAYQAPYPTVWHTIEERERDFPNLYDRCLSTLDMLVEGISHSLPPANNTPPAELAMLVGDYVRQAQSSDFIYVLDDIHHLDGTLPCESWLRTLATNLPSSCHIILISRTLPNLPYPELVAHSEIFTIGMDDLRLTEDEIQKLTKDLHEGPLLASHKQTLSGLDGWPAGVFLALQPLATSLKDSMFGGSSTPETLFEALGRPMLLSLSPDLRNFLLGSSILPYLTLELCGDILGLPNSSEWLTNIQKRNLFLSERSRGLEYHSLFRDFLQRELRNGDPDRFADLHLKAANWFEEIDDIEQAFDHFMAANRAEQAQSLSEKTAIAYFGQGKFETMLNWSAKLHEAGMLAPNLSFECSMIHTDHYDYLAAENELEYAEQGFSEALDSVGLVRVKLQRAMIYLQRGDYQEALELAEEVASLQVNTLQGRALRIIGFAHLRLGDAATSVKYLEEAVRLYRAEGLVSSLSHVLQDLHFAYLRLGRLDEMGSCLQEVIAIRRKLRGKSALALALNALGYYYHRRSNYQEALSTFEEGLRFVAGAPDQRSESYLLASLGDLKRDLGLYGEAQLLYDKALHLAPPDAEPNLYITILISLSTMRRWQSRGEEAVLLAEEGAKIAADHQIAFESAMAEITLWLARAEVDNPSKALEHLKASLEDLHNQDARLEMLEVLGGCIDIANMCGDEKATNEYLTVAGWLIEEVGTAQSLAVEVARNPSLETLIARMPQNTQLIADLQRLREAQSKANKDADVINSISSTTTYRLRVLTLGQEKVERDGKAISIAEWQAALPRELFFYLFFNGPKSRSDAELLFWPDSNPVQVRSLFHTALHCARQALGQNVILFEDEMYLVNPDLKIECDAHQLESWTRQAQLLTSRDARADDLWRKAIAQYGGDFLHSLDFQWVVARREAYGAMHLDALIGLGHCARARNDLKTAVEWFSTALAVDPYSEDIYRQIIRCYAQMGEMSKIQTRFHELKAMLRDELGIEPSQETVTLVRSIIGDS